MTKTEVDPAPDATAEPDPLTTDCVAYSVNNFHSNAVREMTYETIN